ncbi:hypothetical protein [Microlunatus soli]|uniref:Uncharacterized protein n=1 Tax=Microlunatus soli TaxID=630515 RepID=A0A1H1T5H6_9ACTN|nr:hypothetical protein [Microlunatus soli]SDS55512.1 hypothetical protein SAMN04489812_2264 [Microlunatus soli]
MSFQMYSIQPEPRTEYSRPNHLQIELYEIMRGVREAQALARFERRELKKIRRDIRRMERQTRRHPIAERQRDHERV